MLVMSIRTLLLYVVVLIIVRIMGKRELGQLQPFEFVVAILIADLVSIPMSNTGVPIFYGIIPVLTLLVAHLTISQLSLKSTWFRNLTSGRPTIVISKGKVEEKTLRNLRYSLDDLFEQLRLNDVFSIADVEYAILETSGRLSLLLKSSKRPPNIEDFRGKSVTNPPVLVPRNVIVDGEIIDDELKLSRFDNTELISNLDKLGHSDLKKIFICTVVEKNISYIQLKER